MDKFIQAKNWMLLSHPCHLFLSYTDSAIYFLCSWYQAISLLPHSLGMRVLIVQT